MKVNITNIALKYLAIKGELCLPGMLKVIYSSSYYNIWIILHLLFLSFNNIKDNHTFYHFGLNYSLCSLFFIFS